MVSPITAYCTPRLHNYLSLSMAQPKGKRKGKGKGKGKGGGKGGGKAVTVIDGISTEDMTKEQVCVST